jgi:hypothetical protein
MDMTLVHEWAGEFALWSTVTINGWLILTAIIFAVGHVRKITRDYAELIVTSAFWGAYLLFVLYAILYLVDGAIISFTEHVTIWDWLSLLSHFVFYSFITFYFASYLLRYRRLKIK